MLQSTSSVEDTPAAPSGRGTANPGLGRIEARKSALRSRHARINTEIMVEQPRPLPDSLHLLSLKRIRLQIKDELRRLETLARRPARKVRPTKAAKPAPELQPAA